MPLVFEHALDAAADDDDGAEAVAELVALCRRDRSALEAARLRAIAMVMASPHDQLGRNALRLLDEALRRGDERRRWRSAEWPILGAGR